MWHVACLSAQGEATVRARGRGRYCAATILRAVPLDKPFLLSTLRVVATLVIII